MLKWKYDKGIAGVIYPTYQAFGKDYKITKENGIYRLEFECNLIFTERLRTAKQIAELIEGEK